MPSSASVIVLAAGLGTRMQSNRPKVMHPVGGRPMLTSVLKLAKDLQATRTIVVASPENQAELGRAFPDVALAIQEKPLGTGHAVRAGVEALSAHLPNPFDEDVLVLCGDAPLVPLTCLQEMQMLKAKTKAAVVVLAMSPPNPQTYGRLNLGETGDVLEIIEAKEFVDQGVTLSS
ncbi:MAG: NTP transferase domain-containing protein, partial [Alphaproteobacteria bacterium]